MNVQTIVLPRILAALDAVAWERVSANEPRFRRVSDDTPGWLSTIAPTLAAADAPVDLVQSFPVLEAFLPEADAIWRGDGAARAVSDYWTDCARSGEEVHLEAIALHVPESLGVLVIAREEAMYAQHQLLLQRARELLMAHDSLTHEIERKDVLVHCIVHDLSNPLGSILGTLSVLLARGHLDAEDREMVDIALSAAQRQRSLIREILDVFVAEAGAFGNIRTTDVVADLWGEIEQAVATTELDARSRNIRVVRRLIGETSAIPVIAEPSRIARVLGNFLDNALKFAPTRSTVTLTFIDEGPTVRVDIDDEGPGVAPEVVPRLFRRFSRGESGEGTGLGLYFCRITLERWGGSVGYEPHDGKRGARFWFRLRKALARDPA